MRRGITFVYFYYGVGTFPARGDNTVPVDDILIPKSVRSIEIGRRYGFVLVADCSNTDKSDNNDPSHPGHKNGHSYPSTENYRAGHWILEDRRCYLSAAIETTFSERSGLKLYMWIPLNSRNRKIPIPASEDVFDFLRVAKEKLI